ncbi:hypothetical protein GCM10009133_33440 [Cocleimonas flava]|uniref:HipA-like kinase domain-containing protein n=1 Tax=Cocleimonas flava TaxID=634765 RepID=A0A4R1FD99_9GAMM|nr:HipA family kinase [Cocleimonas flava]TCJ88811.1 hypothetical protein EV695_0670 [Cocleimonas flava]
MTKSIIEILGRSTQGATRPYICRADDDDLYFVKGNGAGRQSQVYEWVCGHLAIKLGLPIAPFRQVLIPEELVEGNSDYSELKSGLAFGSQKQILMELNYAGIKQVPIDLQRTVLAFDWWIKNEDRTLSELGGNPNLFWDPDEKSLIVIDHNQAFDPTFSVHSFKSEHVFRQQNNSLFNHALYRSEYRDKFQMALRSWNEITDGLPEEWYYSDPEKTVKANFDLNSMFNILNRCNDDSLWEET